MTTATFNPCERPKSSSGAHKNEIKKGQVALAEAKKEKKETLEKMKAKDAQLKKLEAAKDDSDKLAHAKTQEVIASETPV